MLALLVEGLRNMEMAERLFIDKSNFNKETQRDNDILAALSREYAETLPTLVNPIIAATQRFIFSGDDLAALQTTMRGAHMVKGTAGSYGFLELSMVLSSLEERMQELHDNHHLRWQQPFIENLRNILKKVSRLSDDAVHQPEIDFSVGSEVVGRFRKVMLFDDDLAFCRRVQAILNAENFLTYAFTDVDKFKETLEQIHPDLLFLDIGLGDTDGLKLCRDVRSSNSWKELKIVVITGSNDPVMKIEAMSAGANQFMIKPVNNAELLRVANSCSGSAQLQVRMEDAQRKVAADGDVLSNELLRHAS